MTQVKTLTAPGVALFEDIKRHEHHKVVVSVSSFVSNVSIRIEEIVSSSTNPINLDNLDRTFYLTEEGDTSFVLENMRVDNLRVNFVSGDAELKCLYEGF